MCCCTSFLRRPTPEGVAEHLQARPGRRHHATAPLGACCGAARAAAHEPGWSSSGLVQGARR
eukprot:11380892-Alexandrium_andersonii.AAC.1